MVISENDTVELIMVNPSSKKEEKVTLSRYHAEVIRILKDIAQKVKNG